MFNTPVLLPRKSPFVLKLLPVIEPDLALGGMLVQTIRKETPYQAVLATSVVDAHRILQHLKCDLFLLAASLLPMAEEFSTYLNTLPGYERIAVYFFPAVLGEQADPTNQARSFEGIVNLNISLDEFSPLNLHLRASRELSFQKFWVDAPLPE